MTDALPAPVRRTFCGICEGSCGVLVSGAGPALTIRGDPQHPNSQGYICPKGASFSEIVNDQDRIVQPLRRTASGAFLPVSWQSALDDIGVRLRETIRTHGGGAAGVYFGNPVTWNFAAQASLFGLAAALGTRHLYTALSLDINNYLVVNQWLYGSNFATSFPDIPRTDFLLIVGANPVVSHGSMLTIGDPKRALQAITARGGRVVVVDPRRTETARLFEHLPIRADADAWLLGAMLRIVLDEGLEDRAWLRRNTEGLDFLRELASAFDLQRAGIETGLGAGAIEAMARDFAAASRAALYMRCGASLGQYSTLTRYLAEALNIVTGNLDRPGGAVFGRSMIDASWLGRVTRQNGYDRWRTRVDDIPEVFGSAPAASLAREIVTPGANQLRALIMSSANPVSSAPGSEDVEHALESLDLFVAIDPYLTESTRLAHYVLPPTLWPEREGIPLFTFGHSAIPYAQWSAPVAPARGEARDDAWIVDQIARRVGLTASPMRPARWLGRVGVRLTPSTLMDLALRGGPEGDLFGLRRSGLSRAKLLKHGGGAKLAEHPPTGVLRRRLRRRGGRIWLAHAPLRHEVARLLAHSPEDRDYPLHLISLRELRSQNSWLHNSRKLMAGDRRQRLRLHPSDAAASGVRDGERVSLSSRHGSIEVDILLTEEMRPGVVALPHGWGHGGSWRRAVAAGGASYNRLSSNAPENLDRLTGQPKLNGVPVRVKPLAP